MLCQDDGQPLTRQMVQYRVLRASRRAKLSQDGVHILRHTFCSHLAMRGAPPRAIQELTGHRELGMTQRYMHLSPAALDSAIRLLDQPLAAQSFGDLLETGRVSEGKARWLEQLHWTGCLGRFPQPVDVHLRASAFAQATADKTVDRD